MTDQNKSWHLAQTEAELQLTEFEHRLWRVFNAFIRWQEDCEKNINGTDLSGYELAVLHIIRMKDRPKSTTEIAKLLNRDDITNIQYTVRKLAKLGLVSKFEDKRNKGKYPGYVISEKGIQNTNAYTKTRLNTLVALFANEFDNSDISEVGEIMAKLTGIYEEAARQAAIYDVSELKEESNIKHEKT